MCGSVAVVAAALHSYKHLHTSLTLAAPPLRLSSCPAQLVFVENTADDPSRRKPDITKAKTLLGWEPKVGTAWRRWRWGAAWRGLHVAFRWEALQAAPAASRARPPTLLFLHNVSTLQPTRLLFLPPPQIKLEDGLKRMVQDFRRCVRPPLHVWPTDAVPARLLPPRGRLRLGLPSLRALRTAVQRCCVFWGAAACMLCLSGGCPALACPALFSPCLTRPCPSPAGGCTSRRRPPMAPRRDAPACAMQTAARPQARHFCSFCSAAAPRRGPLPRPPAPPPLPPLPPLLAAPLNNVMRRRCPLPRCTRPASEGRISFSVLFSHPSYRQVRFSTGPLQHTPQTLSLLSPCPCVRCTLSLFVCDVSWQWCTREGGALRLGGHVKGMLHWHQVAAAPLSSLAVGVRCFLLHCFWAVARTHAPDKR